MFQLQGDIEYKQSENHILAYARKKLESLKFDSEKFPRQIFHHAKGVGLIHLKENMNENNIGYGIIFTHLKTNEKKPCGPIFINLFLGKNGNKHLMHDLCPKSDNLLLIFKEESQIYQLMEENNHEICLGIDYNIEGIAKDDYDAILCYQIIDHELSPIEDISKLRGCNIKMNEGEIKSFYDNDKITGHDIYCGKIAIPQNGDFIKSEQYVCKKLMMDFGEVCC